MLHLDSFTRFLFGNECLYSDCIVGYIINTSPLFKVQRIAIRTGNHFPDTDGSFVHQWSTTISFTIARAVDRNASEAARKHRENNTFPNNAT